MTSVLIYTSIDNASPVGAWVALVVLEMGGGWWRAAGSDSSRTREKSGICCLEGLPWPVTEPGVWVEDGEALWQVRLFPLEWTRMCCCTQDKTFSLKVGAEEKL